ncbi:hypothetical protein BKA83DRAFT_4496097 [Pisolithus microcarpus]|nr:hypothetical protein BKA83DRAFT_4496097 [Pisolithus microcarpus]
MALSVFPDGVRPPHSLALPVSPLLLSSSSSSNNDPPGPSCKLELCLLSKALCFLLPPPITIGLCERLKRTKPESESLLEADMPGVAAELHAESDTAMELNAEPHAELEVELHTESDAAMDMDAKSLATSDADESPNTDQGATLHHSTKAACHWNGLPLPG